MPPCQQTSSTHRASPQLPPCPCRSPQCGQQAGQLHRGIMLSGGRLIRYRADRGSGKEKFLGRPYGPVILVKLSGQVKFVIASLLQREKLSFQTLQSEGPPGIWPVFFRLRLSKTPLFASSEAFCVFDDLEERAIASLRCQKNNTNSTGLYGCPWNFSLPDPFHVRWCLQTGKYHRTWKFKTVRGLIYQSYRPFPPGHGLRAGSRQ